MPDASSPKRPKLSERLRLPNVSGKWTVFWLLVCFAITATLIPLVLKRSLWVEFEFVVLAWWLIWTLILTKLLYTGQQINDDYQRKEAVAKGGATSKNGSSDWSGCLSGGDAEGCAIILGLLVALVLVWALIEIVLPIVFFLLYFLIRGMLCHVVNERRHCQEKLGLSVFHGAFWATVYSLPLAGVIWLVHYFQSRP